MAQIIECCGHHLARKFAKIQCMLSLSWKQQVWLGAMDTGAENRIQTDTNRYKSAGSKSEMDLNVCWQLERNTCPIHCEFHWGLAPCFCYIFCWNSPFRETLFWCTICAEVCRLRIVQYIFSPSRSVFVIYYYMIQSALNRNLPRHTFRRLLLFTCSHLFTHLPSLCSPLALLSDPL